MKRGSKFIFIFIFLALLLDGTMSFSQSIKGKVRKDVRTADIELYNNNFQKALELYQRAYAIDTANAQVAFKLGSCMYSMQKYKQQSLPYFEKAQRAGLSKSNYFLGNLYRLEGKFEESIRAFQDYKNSSGKKDFSNAEVDVLIGKSKTA